MIKAKVYSLLEEVAGQLGFVLPDQLSIDEPPQEIEADLSTNIAMQLARQEKKNPRELAEAIKEQLQKFPEIKVVEVAGPGFLNISLENNLYQDVVTVLERPVPIQPKTERVNVEYISANPSGPLHIGNARGGPIGETIVRVLEKLGYEVGREFYVNDIGGQATLFGASVRHYYLKALGVESDFPLKGYPGEYVQELALRIVTEEGERFLALPENEQIEALRAASISRMVAGIKATTERMGISFDRWFWESEVAQNGLALEVLNKLIANHATFEKDGAVWLKSGLMDEDRETVLLKSDGTAGYFLDDLAYHWDKFVNRKYAKAIVVLGANHFGHPPRMQAGLSGLGLDPAKYVGVFYEYIQLKRGAEVVKMAKREGTFVTADEVLDEVPRDVFTYFMLSKSNDTHMDFDLQLAKDHSEKNPIYYIQYAHARIHSVLRQAGEKNVQTDQADAQFSSLERRLVRWLDEYMDKIEEISTTYRTHLLPNYLYELATRFHHLYAHQRIISENHAETTRLLRLCSLTVATLKDGLNLMGIEAMESM